MFDDLVDSRKNLLSLIPQVISIDERPACKAKRPGLTCRGNESFPWVHGPSKSWSDGYWLFLV